MEQADATTRHGAGARHEMQLRTDADRASACSPDPHPAGGDRRSSEIVVFSMSQRPAASGKTTGGRSSRSARPSRSWSVRRFVAARPRLKTGAIVGAVRRCCSSRRWRPGRRRCSEGRPTWRRKRSEPSEDRGRSAEPRVRHEDARARPRRNASSTSTTPTRSRTTSRSTDERGDARDDRSFKGAIINGGRQRRVRGRRDRGRRVLLPVRRAPDDERQGRRREKAAEGAEAHGPRTSVWPRRTVAGRCRGSPRRRSAASRR